MALVAFSTEETLALKTLLDGVVRLEQGAWWIVAHDHAREVPTRLVQGLRGEGLLTPTDGGTHGGTDAELRLTARGRRLAEAAAAGLAARGASDERAARALLTRGPLALLRPAADSEEVDYLLAIRLDAAEIAAHRARAARAAEAAAADPDGFVFLQYRGEVAALPLSPAAIPRGLVPPEGATFRIVRQGLSPETVDVLGARGCPDRGVDYFADAVQWFGGFGEADPLITSPRLRRSRLEAMLREAETTASARA